MVSCEAYNVICGTAQAYNGAHLAAKLKASGQLLQPQGGGKEAIRSNVTRAASYSAFCRRIKQTASQTTCRNTGQSLSTVVPTASWLCPMQHGVLYLSGRPPEAASHVLHTLTPRFLKYAS